MSIASLARPLTDWSPGEGPIKVGSRWSIDAGGHGTAISWTPAGLVALGGEPSYLRLDEDGVGLGQSDPGPFFGKPPAPRPDGGFYVSQVSALESYDRTGAPQWSRSPSQSLSTVAVSGPEGNCYVADHDHLYAYGPDGQELWRKTESISWDETPVTVGPDGTVYMPTSSGSVVAYSPAGQELWRFDGLKVEREGFGFSPLRTDLAVGPDGTVYVGDQNKQLHAVREGKLLWSRPLGQTQERYDTPAVDKNGTVYASAGERQIAFSPDGRELWSRQLGATLHLTAHPQGGVLVGIRGGPLHCLNDQGQWRWTYDEADTLSRPVFDPSGKAYTSSYGRYVHALESSPLEPPIQADPEPPPGLGVGQQDGYFIVGGVRLRARQGGSTP